MGLFTARELSFARAVSRLAHSNPFLPERIDGERAALGSAFARVDPVWSLGESGTIDTPNTVRIAERVEALARTLVARLDSGARLASHELEPYDDLVLHVLYYRYEGAFRPLLDSAVTPGGLAATRPGSESADASPRDASLTTQSLAPAPAGGSAPLAPLAPLALGVRATAGGPDHAPSRRPRIPYREFLLDIERFLASAYPSSPTRQRPAHILACFFQIRRAFHHIFTHIVGRSLPAARVRAAAWQSIFTHDMRRYRRTLALRMGDVTTLITGPSGTGKDLVARAIGLSHYVPFDPTACAFTQDPHAGFFTLNVSALSPQLVESELFGHRRGAFTGAVQDRIGWLEACPAGGTVFLDEVGDVDPSIQVKLLHVLQQRAFQRLGETSPRRFQGKIIAATHRDLTREMDAGRFRRDFYYRLCSDVIQTPSLREQLDDDPAELASLVAFLARRIAGPEEASSLCQETLDWIDRRLGSRYPWPGNVRELEQCVRNVMIRREYHPPLPSGDDPRESLARALSTAGLTAGELLALQCTAVYSLTGSYVDTARRLGLDRRTVRAKLDPGLLSRLAGASPGTPPPAGPSLSRWRAPCRRVRRATVRPVRRARQSPRARA